MTAITESYVDQAMQGLNFLASYVHRNNVKAGWWTDMKYDSKVGMLMTFGETEERSIQMLSALGIERSTVETRNVGELLCLVHSELSEAMEGYRKNLQDDKLPHRKMFEVEIVDTLVRIFDIAGAHGLDLAGAMKEKMEYNAKREDHKLENRSKENGKKF